MEKTSDYAGMAFEIIPRLCEYISSTARLSGITATEALLLLIITEQPTVAEFYISAFSSAAEALAEHGAAEKVNGKYVPTAKGAIIARSLSGAKERFNKAKF